jgi:WD40 repeat protein
VNDSRVKRAALILLLGVIAAGCGGSASSGTHENGPIVLSGQPAENESPGLFLRETDGTLRRLTTATDGQDVLAAFSHDGKRIAYIHLMKGLQSGTGRLMVADADGKNAEQVGDIVAVAYQIAWSPDDKSLLYSGVPRGLWTVGTDGSGATLIFEDGGDASWSSEGRIVIARPTKPLTTMAEDGSDVRNLPRPRTPAKAMVPDTYHLPAWSPDGKRIAYLLRVWIPSKDYLFPTTLETVDADGGDRHVVTKVFSVDGTTLSWSPDGKSFAFTDLRDEIPGLWKIPSTGGKATPLIYNNGSYYGPSWGPAGT